MESGVEIVPFPCLFMSRFFKASNNSVITRLIKYIDLDMC